MVTSDIVSEKFRQWTQGRNDLLARIEIYQRIRDIPYAVILELNTQERYVEILKHGKGSCLPKHFLLCDMYQRLGLMVLYALYPFRWDDLKVNYPPNLRKLAEELPTSYHLACRVDIDGKLVLVDATLDLTLGKIGLPVNRQWDGVSDTVIPVNPCGDEQLYHPADLRLDQTQPDPKSVTFYNELNRWLEEIRHLVQ